MLEVERDQPWNSPRLTKGAWASLGVALVFAATGVAFVAMLVTGASDGMRLQPGGAGAAWQLDGVMVMPLAEAPSALQAGDVVVGVDGKPLSTWAEGVRRPWAGTPAWDRGRTVTYTVRRDGQTRDIPVTLRAYPRAGVAAKEWGALFLSVVVMAVALFVFFQRPNEPVARVFLVAACGMASASYWSFGLQVVDLMGGPRFWLFHITTVAGYMLLMIGFFHSWLVFPPPARASCRWWTLPLLYGTPLVVHGAFLTVTQLQSDSTFRWLGGVDKDVGILEAVYLCLGLVGVAWRQWSVRDPVGRKQVRLVLYAGLFSGFLGLALGVLPQLFLREPLVSWNVLAVLGLPLPVAMGVSVLRYRLFDIDPIVNRTLVYGALTAMVITLYVIVVGYLGARLQETGSLMVSIAAAGLVAVLFNPLRAWLQRGVNRLMYGERDEPYRVLSRLGQRLEGTLAPAAVLPAAGETIGRALKLPYAAVALKEGDGFSVVASYGSGTDRTSAIPLVYQGDVFGRLLLAPRAGEPLGVKDQRLLADLARQVGVVAHAVRLTADLRRSRQQIVAAREEERRRIRRDLHDGLGPALASMALKLDAARNLLPREPAAAEALLLEVKGQTQAAIANIRGIVYALRPPALDQLRLVPASREYVAHLGNGAAEGTAPSGSHSLRVTVEAPTTLPPLAAAVEVAAYRIAIEALTNVVRHADASAWVVRFSFRDTSLDMDLALAHPLAPISCVRFHICPADAHTLQVWSSHTCNWAQEEARTIPIRSDRVTNGCGDPRRGDPHSLNPALPRRRAAFPEGWQARARGKRKPEVASSRPSRDIRPFRPSKGDGPLFPWNRQSATPR